MAERKTAGPPPRRGAPAKTPEDRQNQLINLALDMAEDQMRKGTATSQIVTHFMKLATLREQKEIQKLELENELLRAKRESIDRQGNIEELYKDAITAMRKYQGNEVDEYDD